MDTWAPAIGAPVVSTTVPLNVYGDCALTETAESAVRMKRAAGRRMIRRMTLAPSFLRRRDALRKMLEIGRVQARERVNKVLSGPAFDVPGRCHQHRSGFFVTTRESESTKSR